MDVLLESYKTDDIVYNAEGEAGVIPPTEEERARIKHYLNISYFRIYLNFNGYVPDMLKFFYAAANDFNRWGVHANALLYSTNGERIDWMYSNFFDRNFSAYYEKRPESIELCADMFLQNFKFKNDILILPPGNDAKLYIIDQIKKFTLRVEDHLNRRQNVK